MMHGRQRDDMALVQNPAETDAEVHLTTQEEEDTWLSRSSSKGSINTVNVPVNPLQGPLTISEAAEQTEGEVDSAVMVLRTRIS